MGWLKGRAMARGIAKACRVVLALTLAQWALARAGIEVPALWLACTVIARAALVTTCVLVTWNVSSFGAELMRRADREPHPELLRVPEEFRAGGLRYMGPPPVFVPGIRYDQLARVLEEYTRRATEAAVSARVLNAAYSTSYKALSREHYAVCDGCQGPLVFCQVPQQMPHAHLCDDCSPA